MGMQFPAAQPHCVELVPGVIPKLLAANDVGRVFERQSAIGFGNENWHRDVFQVAFPSPEWRHHWVFVSIRKIDR